ncbi:MAG: acyltransferase [Actinomycetota bacterium]
MADRPRLSHQPALDGLRGAAVAGVVAFHLGYLSGGFLGVDLFFTLSGYLITRLLLIERDGTGRIDLGGFWSRRAWRLLPALFLVVSAVALYAWIAARPDELDGIRGGGLSSLVYVTNWYFLATGDGYWNLFTAPTPFDHLWSLAIEEQFYVAWPLVFLGLTRGGTATRLTTFTAIATVATAIYMAAADPADAYLNTITRSSSILLGALLAIAAHRDWPAFRRVLTQGSGAALSIASLAFLVFSWIVVDGSADESFFRGGFFAHAIAVAIVIGRVTLAPGGLEARLFTLRPLRVLGLVSYGLYLWHWPVIVIVDLERTDTDGAALLLLRLSVMALLTAVSYIIIERPARHSWSRIPQAVWGLPVAAVIAGVLLGAGTRPPPVTSVVGAIPTTTTTTTETPTTETPTTETPTTGTDPATPRSTTTTTAPPLLAATPDEPLRVLLVGDSYLFDVEPAIDAAFAEVAEIDIRRGARFGFAATDDDALDLLAAARAEHQPDVVVTMWARFDQGWLEDRGLTAEANDELEARFVEAFEVLGGATETSAGAQVVVVGLAPSLTAGIDRLPVDRTINDVFQRAASALDYVSYLDPDPVVAPNGEPERWIIVDGAELLVRKADVSHYCADGAARWGQSIGVVLEQLTGVAPADPTDWWAGEWRDDPRYDDPVGACAP